MTQLDDIPGPSQIYSCEFCQPQPPIATLSELNEHLKSAHIDLVFHCETCDNFVDRNSLIIHMMQHLKENQERENQEPPEEQNLNNQTKVVRKLDKSDDDEPLVRDKSNHMKKDSGANVKFLKKCHYCPKLFSNRSGRLYHEEQAHFQRRRFQCDQCESGEISR